MEPAGCCKTSGGVLTRRLSDQAEEGAAKWAPRAARQARPLQTGLRPETPRDRYAGTPRAPLRDREARRCAPGLTAEEATPEADASLPRTPRGFSDEAFFCFCSCLTVSGVSGPL